MKQGDKFKYKTVIRSVLLYGSEICALTKAEQDLLLDRTGMIMSGCRARAGVANTSETL